jgi:hypothetical protein
MFFKQEGSLSSLTAKSEAPILPSKIALEKNSKGVNFTIELRCQDGDEVNTLDRLNKLFEAMKHTYKDQQS